MIAFTGDLLSLQSNNFQPELTEPLSALSAPDGVVGTLGNHDHRPFFDIGRMVMDRAHMIDLDNAVHVVRRGADSLYFAGVGSIIAAAGAARPRARTTARRCRDDPLAHEPDFADISSATERFALQLSGHTHGGQIRLPFLTNFALPLYGRRYLDGVTQLGEMVLHVSRGVGTVGLPLRFNCPPEINVITLRSARRWA